MQFEIDRLNASGGPDAVLVWRMCQPAAVGGLPPNCVQSKSIDQSNHQFPVAPDSGLPSSVGFISFSRCR